jgi:glycosyltransferase involved in cell wall biosynthesis
MLISIVVSTYNDPKVLRVCLDSFLGQTDQGFEIVVADDGSGEATRRMVDDFRAVATFPVKHAWQEDRAYRLARSRNNALLQCAGDYLIFMDGDCFVLPDFVKQHRALAKAGFFVSGKRSYLRSQITQDIVSGKIRPGAGRLGWLLKALTNQCTRLAQFIVLPDGSWRYGKADEWRKVQTCNLGAWRADVDRVNGFDSSYIGHGFEDSDFVVRMIRSGARRKLGDHGPVVMHLEHPRPTPQVGLRSPNADRFETLLAGDGFRAQEGVAELAV